jgi:amino acid adenylation domain-containing protein
MLDERVVQAAARRRDALAVRGPEGELTYGSLDAKANQVARLLAGAGIATGDRVAIWLPKGTDAVAAMQGALRLGAAYVPVDPLSPPARAATVMRDCGVRALVAAKDAAVSVLDDMEGVFLLPSESLRPEALSSIPADPVPRPVIRPDDLAYILYTSGSTGRPKGVCISHANAIAFVDWAVDALAARESDRFSSHAPFHFDLSVLDLYAAFSVGAAVHLVPEGAAYAAEHLVRFLRSERISVWYSVPSAITLMMEHGGLLTEQPQSLRALLFAGEPFPMKHLRRLREAWPRLVMWNLYGPTETNVCTAYQVGSPIDPSWTSIPIGRAVSGDRVWAKTADGAEAKAGEEGELMVEGPTVFPGYWGQPPRACDAYGTGDIVRLGADGDFCFLGRRDNMVKVRGHRIELGEIESGLLQHPSVREAAALVHGEGLAARLVVFLGIGESAAPTLLEVKRLCAQRLPRYMIPDDAVSMVELPRNRNGKVDRRALAATIASGFVVTP